MSNQEMARRLYDTLSAKAALGMGEDDSAFGRGYGTRKGALKGSKTRRMRGKGYGTRKGALKAWRTRRMRGEGDGEGYGTREGALKAWRTRRERMGMGIGGARRKKVKGKKKVNPWIEFIKAYAFANRMTYREALGDPRACKTYRDLEHYSVDEMPCKRPSVREKRELEIPRLCPPGRRVSAVRAFTRELGNKKLEKVRNFERCIRQK
jgi:hypothetical protein